MGIPTLINHMDTINEICGVMSDTKLLEITRQQVMHAVTEFYMKYINKEVAFKEDATMEKILFDIHNPLGYKTSTFQQKCLAVFIRVCAPLIFASVRNNVTEYTRMLLKYGIKYLKQRTAMIQTSRRAGKSQVLKLFACTMAKNVLGLRVVYISKDEKICNMDYSETLSFAKAVRADITNKECEITFNDLATRRKSKITFLSGHAPDVSYLFFIIIVFFCICRLLNYMCVCMFINSIIIKKYSIFLQENQSKWFYL